MSHTSETRARVSIRESALITISEEMTRSPDGLETGGILLGFDHPDRMIVSQAGEPGPNAVRSKHRFLRDLAYAQELAGDAWASEGSQWIGEWHSHPDGQVEPSPADLESYLRHLSDADLVFARFLSIIAIPTPAGAVAAAWIVDAESCVLASIEISEEE